jgi:hypothetical protein
MLAATIIEKEVNFGPKNPFVSAIYSNFSDQTAAYSAAWIYPGLYGPVAGQSAGALAQTRKSRALREPGLNDNWSYTWLSLPRKWDR